MAVWWYDLPLSHLQTSSSWLKLHPHLQKPERAGESNDL